MIDQINDRLIRWADWATNGHRARGLWYSPCTLRKWMVRCSLARSVDVVYDEEAGKTDKAVTALPVDLKAVIVVYYLKPGTIAQKAKDLHCDKRTLYRRLHHAQQRVDEYLNSRTVERVSPAACVFAAVRDV